MTSNLTTITTATGLTIVCRRIKGDDTEDIYRAERKRKNVDIATHLLRRCTVDVPDPGIYGDKFATTKDFTKILSGDRYHALMKLRSHTFGSDYRFTISCPSCREPIRWEVDIDELPVNHLHEGHLERLKAGEREFDDKVEGYGAVKVLYQDGEIENAIRRDREQHGHSALMATILNRITAIGDTTGKGNIYELVKEADATLMDELFAICGKHDFGLDIVIGVQCGRVGCGAVGEVLLPFDLRFLLPKSARVSS